ncbi:MAG: amidohydrolase family protein, partial [Spirochaetota bacterium]
RLAFGSNAPAGPVSPLHGILLAVERKGAEEGPELRFFPRERLSLEDAVYAYTAGAAAAVGLEEGGSLEPGKVADMVHLSLDIFRGGGRAGRLAGGAEALLRARVVRTYVGGEPVYERRAGEGVPAPAGGENGGEIGESGESGG